MGTEEEEEDEMLLRTYRGEDLGQALAKVKADLGDQATIISTRRVRRGLLSSELEVTATLPVRRSPPPALRPARSKVAPAPPARSRASSAIDADVLAQVMAPLRREMARLREDLSRLAAGVDAQGLQPGEERRMERALSELLSMVEETSYGVAMPLAAAAPLHSSVSLAAAAPLQSSASLAAAPTSWSERLESRGMATRTAAELAALIAAQSGAGELADIPATHLAAAALQKRLRHIPPLDRGELSCRRVALVGPAGAGKTTTLAKVAARAALVSGRSVAIIGYDNERVGAAASVKSLAATIDVPCWIARSEAQLTQALARFSEKNLVLIDTTGYSPRQPEALQELGEVLANHDCEAHLLLSAELREMEMESVLESFALLAPRSLSLSKVDQMVGLGAIYDAALRSELPLLYLTTGRAIPDDLEEATPARVASMILGLNYN